MGRTAERQLAQVTPRLTWTWPLASVVFVTTSVQSSSSASKARPTLMAGQRPSGRIPVADSPMSWPAAATGLADDVGIVSLPIDAEGVAATAAQRPAAAVTARTIRDVRLANGLSRETTM